MNINERIEQAKNLFTKSDQAIYDCIMKDPWLVIRGSSTIIELAEKCEVSKSAILRFAKKLGYSGYSEFKYDFAVSEHSNIPKEANKNNLDYILSAYESTIRDFKKYIKEEDFVYLAEEIVRADKIRICGFNRSGFSATHFKYRLLNLGVESEAVTDSLFLGSILGMPSKYREIYLFFTVRGKPASPLNAFIEDCYKKNYTTIIITMNQNTEYRKYVHKMVLLPGLNTGGVFLDEQGIFHIFIEILLSYMSEILLKK